MRSLRLIIIYSLIVLFYLNSCSQRIIEGSTKSVQGTIVIQVTEDDREETRAAQILQKYLRQISGNEFPITTENTAGNSDIISIENSNSIHPYEVGYQWSKDTFVLSAGEKIGTVAAVYYFLEKELGVRFYSPTVEKVPVKDNFKLDKTWNASYTPDITTRTVHSRLFYENPEFAEKLRVTDQAFPNYVPAARVHTFHRFLPASKFYDEHPEYYALRSGERRTTQLCLTNEDVFRIVRDSVTSMLRQFPEANVISVSQDDNTQYCQCDQCERIHKREKSPAGSMIYFVNRIAREFPDKQISTLAYQYTRKAPQIIKPLENVLITLCSIECDRSAPIEQKCPDFLDDLKSWSAISDNIRIWDYTTQFTNFLAPFPNLHTLQPNVQLFEENNAKWIFEQHSNQPSELFELRSYLTAQLLWNHEANQEDIVNDFLNGYYEDAAPYVKSYIDEVHEELQKDSSFFLFLYGDPSQGFESFLSLDLLKKYDGYFESAIKSVKRKKDIVWRVNAARLSIDYAILEYARRDMSAFKSLLDVENRLNRFVSTCDTYKITTMNEMRFTVDEYVKGYRSMMERASKPNKAKGAKVTLLTNPKKYADENPQVLTDGALGGSNFYANWLGFEGNDMEAIIELENEKKIQSVSMAFLQVTNHLVFLPEQIIVSVSTNGENFKKIGDVSNDSPLTPDSKINDVKEFSLTFDPVDARFLKITARNMEVAPEWHNGSGLPAWLFVDEVVVEKVRF